MKILKILSVMVAVSIFIAGSACAESVSMILWYPGEAGTTEQAQPIIDELFAYMGDKLKDVKFEGRYHNTVEGGIKYIAGARPTIGIVSYSALSQFHDRIGSPKTIMATLPLPGGRSSERYSLVKSSADSGETKAVVSSEPLDISFVREKLFPNIPADAAISQTGQMFQALRRISSGELKAAAILTPMEAESLSRLSSDWARGLVVAERSGNVPTARLVLFDASWPHVERLREALAAAGRDPEAKDLLLELRLRGFQSTD